MLKKSFLVLVLAAVIAAGAFAQSVFRLSAGVGGRLTKDFGAGVEASIGSLRTGYLKTPYLAGGAYVFFDATFFEVNFGVFGAGGEWEIIPGGPHNVSVVGLDIGLTAKLPIVLNRHVTIFPALGVNYMPVLSAEVGGPGIDDPNDLSVFWCKIGGGADFSLASNVYLRTAIFYGIRPLNRYEKDYAAALDRISTNVAVSPGHALDIRLAVGYRF